MSYFNRHIALYCIILAVIVFGVLWAPTAPSAYAAQESYTFLTPVPGLDRVEAVGGNLLEKYITTIFRLFLITLAFSAAVMIVYAGVQYIASGASPSQRESARNRIENAIYGLLIALGSVFLLNQINPNIVSKGFALDNLLKPIKIEYKIIPSGGQGNSLGENAFDRNLKVQNTLGNENVIVIPNATPCLEKGTNNSIPFKEFKDKYGGHCTTVLGLPQKAIDGLGKLTHDCKCQVMLTGGTEKGHKTHGPGRAVVDLRRGTLKLDEYIEKNGVRSLVPFEDYEGGDVTYLYTLQDGTTFLKEPKPNHWHVVIQGG